MDFLVVIPARYQSTRLPGKPLRLLAGKPLLQHVYECVSSIPNIRSIIATDDERIARVAREFGADVCMTSAHHESGTQRVGEVIQQRNIPAQTIVVNLQGDEPLMPAACIQQVAAVLITDPTADIATLSAPLYDIDSVTNANVVKVVCDQKGYALYFSRAVIPHMREAAPARCAAVLAQGIYQRHIGLYAYRAGYVQKYTGLPPSPYEPLEYLEQLRVLWHGGRIRVATSVQLPGPGVDTEQELRQVESILQARNTISRV
ncbi:MAG: 3-deoxy-manno-octulosonate cytidylyltransferase [Gammaproteobacteria bacterium]|nr:3-deoxy-manno-octulosonate cytidylyltransferase [Gammaproteobacteria bacterium]